MRKTIHKLETVALAVAWCFIEVAASGAIPLQVGDQDNDTTRAEIASFDRFLDTHPAIAAELQKNPSLVNDSSYVGEHSALNAYLNDHPQVREELRENPESFTNAEQQFDQNGPRPPARFNRGEKEENMAAFDEYLLDYHPGIAQQLAKDPSLVNNPDYLRDHPALQQYLRLHPGVREEIQANPRAFMAGEQRYDASGGDTTPGEVSAWVGFLSSHPDIAQALARDPSLSDNAAFIKSHPAFQKLLAQNPGIHGELIENAQEFMSDVANPGRITEFDAFLDSHPAIAQELFRHPSLAQNAQYLASHAELQQYLQGHPNISQALATNPRGFMDLEQRYDAQTSRRPRLLPRTVGEFDQFLDSHPAIARELGRNPSLVSDQEYLTIHPDLQQYLQSHPAVDQELAAHPDAFMSAEERYDRSGDQARLYGMGSVGIRGGGNDTSTELKSFGSFLSGHPEVAEQLRAHPAMLNNEAFVRDHPELQSYLKTNPGVAEELRENPQAFMTQLGQSSRSSGMSRKSSASEQTPQKLTPNPSH